MECGLKCGRQNVKSLEDNMGEHFYILGVRTSGNTCNRAENVTNEHKKK
jgi:hypothetical protein